MTTPEYTPEFLERFYSRVNKTNNPDECWEWTRGKTGDGYGLISLRRKHILTHRMAWELSSGAIPNGLHVLHSCDNPSCCNPKHLFLGTNTDNIHDRNAKGRANRAKGEKSGSHKLTEYQVLEIRNRYAAGGIYQYELAKEYGVKQPAISLIISGINWSWLYPSS